MFSPLAFGVHTSFWLFIGSVRFFVEKIEWLIKHGEVELSGDPKVVKLAEACVCVPAHNEEKTIAKTIESLLANMAADQIYVVSDCSKDRTVAIALSYGCRCLELNPNRGKARALLALIRHFDLLNKYKIVLFVDSDSVLPADYLKKILPVFKEQRIAAVSAYSATQWEDNPIVAHRQRLYCWGQIFSRYGQSWKWFNANWIIPGFASAIRSRVLKKIDLDAKGIVTEDLYMTFDIHHKKLGVVYHHPSIRAYTQDPQSLKEYMRQIDRWNLGLWQTIRSHKLWFSKVCFFLTIFLLESIIFSILIIFSPAILVVALSWIFADMIFPMPAFFIKFAHYYLIFIGFYLLLNFSISLFISIVEHNWKIIKWELTYFWLYYLDSWSLLKNIYPAFTVTSNGSWVPPERR